MIVQYLVTSHFGDGLCVYRAEYEKPEDYRGDLEKKVAGPFDTYEDAEKCAAAFDENFYIL